MSCAGWKRSQCQVFRRCEIFSCCECFHGNGKHSLRAWRSLLSNIWLAMSHFCKTTQIENWRASSSSSFSSSIRPLGFEDDRVRGPDARFWNRRGSPTNHPSPLPSPHPMGRGWPKGRRSGEGDSTFMAQTHGQFLEVFALHDPPHPFPLPIRWGEGGRRSGEGSVRTRH